MKRLIFTLIVLALMATPALAGPTWPEGWSTHQRFDFLPGDMVGTPSTTGGGGPVGTNTVYTYVFNATIDDNPYGTPDTLISADDYYIPGGYSDDGYFLAWEIIVGSGMYIPNTDVPRPIKRIWIEIGYDPELVDSHVTLSPTGSPVGTKTYEDLSAGSYQITYPSGSTLPWTIAEIEWTLRPNPSEEYLWFHFLDQGTAVDYIEVWTQCVPAPGAIILGSIGVGLVGWLRRRKSL